MEVVYHLSLLMDKNINLLSMWDKWTKNKVLSLSVSISDPVMRWHMLSPVANIRICFLREGGLGMYAWLKWLLRVRLVWKKKRYLSDHSSMLEYNVSCDGKMEDFFRVWHHYYCLSFSMWFLLFIVLLTRKRYYWLRVFIWSYSRC